MPGPLLQNQPNIFAEGLPGPLKALLEMAFPPDSLGIDPAATMMPVAPILGALGKVAPEGILGRLGRVSKPPGAPGPVSGFAEPVSEAAGKLPPMQIGPTKGLPELPAPAFGHGIPDYVPVGGESAFNALRSPEMGRAISNASPMRQTLDEITAEVGHEGLRDLMKRPIPGRQVQAPPRIK